MFHFFHRVRRHTISFKHAADGMLWALKTQPNYQIHLGLSIISIAAGFFFEVSQLEWFMIALLVTMGLVVETINSALEATLDAVSLDVRDDIKIAKDAAAAAMLIFAVGSAAIAAVIFVPKIMVYFGISF